MFVRLGFRLSKFLHFDSFHQSNNSYSEISEVSKSAVDTNILKILLHYIWWIYIYGFYSCVTPKLQLFQQNIYNIYQDVSHSQKHFSIEREMLDSTNSDPDFMNTIITGDESWVYGYDPEPVSYLTMKIQWEH
jgi:hypothetical protein